MRPQEIPTSKAKLRLLDAAEQRVSEKGFDAVSVRDVTQLAKANVAAVNYHFGSRETMMGLVISRRMAPIVQQQLDRLTVLEKKRGSKAVAVEELLEAYLRPLLELPGLDEAKFRAHWPVIAKILILPAASLPEDMKLAMAELWKRYLKALGKSLSAIERKELAWRLHLINGMASRLLIGDEALQAFAGLSSADESSEQMHSRLLRMAVPAMREGAAPANDPKAKKGPQATFDF